MDCLWWHSRNDGVSIWKQVTCLQNLRLMHDIIEPKSRVKENQLESFEPGVSHSNLTDHVTLEIVVGVSMWSLSDAHCLGPSHFIQVLCQTFGKDLQLGKWKHMCTSTYHGRRLLSIGHDGVELRELSINKHSQKNGQDLPWVVF